MNEFLANPNVDKIFKTIADALGTTVDMVRTNALDYILEFGRYSYIETTTFMICLSVVMGIVIVFGGTLIVRQIRIDFSPYNEYRNDAEIAANKLAKKAFKVLTMMWVGTTFVFILCETMLYLSSPTIYSTTRLLELIRGY